MNETEAVDRMAKARAAKQLNSGRLDVLDGIVAALSERVQKLEGATAQAQAPSGLSEAERAELIQLRAENAFLRSQRQVWLSAEAAKGAPPREPDPQGQPPRQPRIVPAQARIVQVPNDGRH